MLDTLRERLTELERLQQRADRLREKSGTTQISREFYERVHTLAEQSPENVDPTESVEVDVQDFADILQAAVDFCASRMLGLGLD